MSEEEKAYMRTIGQPLTPDERNVAIQMREQQAAVYSQNISRLEAELRWQQGNLKAAEQETLALTTDWDSLGPDSTIYLSERTRRTILDGLSVYGIAVAYNEEVNISARFIPDETEAHAKGR
jgi:hypothetical protein